MCLISTLNEHFRPKLKIKTLCNPFNWIAPTNPVSAARQPFRLVASRAALLNLESGVCGGGSGYAILILMLRF